MEKAVIGRFERKGAEMSSVKADHQRISIDASSWKLESPKNSYIVVDADSHRDFIKEMIAGEPRPAELLLLIGNDVGGFENAFTSPGQSIEHALILAFTLGGRQMISCCNRTDGGTPEYGEAAEELSSYLQNAGDSPESTMSLGVAAKKI